MKILWLDINSSYSHSSVALPAIHAQVCDRKGWEWAVIRGTINDNPGMLAATVAEENPDIIASTFWLFTHQMQIEVLSRTVQLIDGVKVVCGGPEFLGNNEDFLKKNPFITAVIRGEGEIALPRFLDAIDNPPAWNTIEGLCWISKPDGIYHENGIARVADFASLKYPEESPFFKWDKPFVQLETTRGCFNTCAFCVSGGEKPVRYQSIDQVKARLENIYLHGIKDIRVLDRTFNYDVVRACEMLDLFKEYAGNMRFHLEIHPSLISDVLKEKLASLPKGLLHLEAGIQSLDSHVLAESGRKGSLESSLKGLEYLCSLDNLETHADLIAGLPAYSLDMLCADITRLVSLGVDELQVESLKVLPGTQMRKTAAEKGLKYSPRPPYEILQTPSMSPKELRVAMQVSRMLDFYYNAKPWQKVIRSLICEKEGFILDFTAHLDRIMVLDSPLSLERRGVILYEYCREHHHDKLTDVSIAWIEAGCSLKKEPAGDITKIKNLDAYLEESCCHMSIEYGTPSASHRYFLLTSHDRRLIFGYDSELHQPAPVFMAGLSARYMNV
jgi:MoaA/NifB/PqqE/SkfB family radical SAM enzyme